MTTMMINGESYEVKYVSAKSSGGLQDGSNPTNAMRHLPAVWAPNTVYLLRRDTDADNIYNSFSSTTSLVSGNYVLLGMPNPGEPLYEQLPTEAKTAWGADNSAEGAWVKYTNSSMTHVQAVNDKKTVIVGNVNIETPLRGVTAYLFHFSGKKLLKLFNFKLTHTGFDLEKAHNHNNSTSYTSLVSLDADVIDIKNINMQIVRDANNTATYCKTPLYLRVKKNLVMDSVVIYDQMSRMVSQKTVEIINSNEAVCEIGNIDLRIIPTGYTDVGNHYQFSLRDAVIRRLENLRCSLEWNCNDALIAGYTGPSNGIELGGCNVENYAVIKNLVVDKPEWVKGRGFTGTGFTDKSATFKGLEIDHSGIGDKHSGINNDDVCNVNGASLIDGLSVKCKKTKNNYSSLVLLSVSHAKSVLVEGSVELRSCGRIDIERCDSEVEFNDYCIEAINTDIVNVKQMNCYGEFDGSKIISINNSRVFVSNINVDPVYFSVSSQEKNAIYFNNIEAHSGNWFGITPWYRGRTWAVARTGGSSASLKLWCHNNSVNPSKYLSRFHITPTPAKPLSTVPNSTGKKLFKLFFAYKDYPDVDPTDLNITVRVPYDDNGVVKYKMFYATEFLADDSGYVGDTGLTERVACVPIDVTMSTEPIEYFITFSKNEESGYIYLDPVAVIE